MRVYAVWFNMVWTDSRSFWSSSLLNDARVIHYWDEEKTVGRWYSRNETGSGDGDGVVWDAYFLYDKNAEWGDNQAPQPVSWGRTIMASRSRLKTDLARLLDGNEGQ